MEKGTNNILSVILDNSLDPVILMRLGRGMYYLSALIGIKNMSLI